MRRRPTRPALRRHRGRGGGDRAPRHAASAAHLDPQVLRSAELGFLNGHVPVTAVITAAARGRCRPRGPRRRGAVQRVVGLVADVIDRRPRPSTTSGPRARCSSRASATLVAARLWVRPFGVLLPAAALASCGSPSSSRSSSRYHGVFRSCNRAFHQDPAERLDHWCGGCDKCCFIDLDPGAVHGPRRARRRVRRRASRLSTRPTRSGSAPCSASRPDGQAVRVRRRRRRVPGRAWCWRRRVPTGPADPLLQPLARRDGPGNGRSSPSRPRSWRPSAPTTFRSAMPRLTSWSELANAAVGVWGLGVEGRASVRKLRVLGITPTLVDDAPAGRWLRRARGPRHRARWPRRAGPLRRGRQEPRASAATGPRSPASRRPASPYAAGSGCGSRRADRSRVACITGTKGKSTTTALCRPSPQQPRPPRRGGREHRPTPVGPRRRPETEPAFWVIETSSFQVPDLTTAPPVVARDVAVPRPPRLARQRRALLRRQAVAVHQARGGAGPRRRFRSAAATTRAGPRVPPPMGAAPMRPRDAEVVRGRRPARPAQCPQRD